MVDKASKTKKKLRLGIDAVCSVQQRRLHPKKVIEEVLINSLVIDHYKGLLVMGTKTIKVNSKLQQYITFRHPKFKGKEIFCVRRWVHVVTEGS